jgi:O-antigen/teichoic acid export membrane protein
MTMLVMVLSVSLTIPYLGAERFGVWMTIASFAGMLSFLDLGIGNALTNRVSYVESRNNNKLLRNTISGGIGVLLVIGVTSSITLFNLSIQITWHNLIKVQDNIYRN